ncbi:hypothetical protein [Variovorax rhizosphaerae]|uniref:Uncharacterized protein n=1 Tax=Variovorax rhizosphaerae TaxID=1836200 RepID=A0ABU8WWS0_9BURK
MRAQLPIHLSTGEEIDKLRVLMLAGLVKGEIDAPVRAVSGQTQVSAAVYEITPIGRVMASKFPVR